MAAWIPPPAPVPAPDGAATPSTGWFRVVPRRVQAWREADELADRDLMRDGRWLA